MNGPPRPEQAPACGSRKVASAGFLFTLQNAKCARMAIFKRHGEGKRRCGLRGAPVSCNGRCAVRGRALGIFRALAQGDLAS